MTPSLYFPAAEDADRYGLIGVGGELTTDWLVDGYRHGIFPWPTQDGILAWWSPDPRAVIEFANLHISRRLARTWASGRFEVTCDRDFPAVIAGCATAQDRADGTWITQGMREAYCRLHQEGVAHSIEVWHAGQLVGGLYGVAIGAMFAGESMFYRVRDASKVALVTAVGHLAAAGFELFDIQQLTPHTARLGATNIPRRSFLHRLVSAVDRETRFPAELAGSAIWQR
jgi:leucyl/phenylalanyl-tRNA--protein transferase